MQLQGHLSAFPLRELVELACATSMTGYIELARDAAPVRLYTRDGNMLHAVWGPIEGHDALALFFAGAPTTFEVVADLAETPKTLYGEPGSLLAEAHLAARTWSEVLRFIPGPHLVPTLVASTNQVRISDTNWPVVAQIDGVRTPRAIGDEIAWSLLATCKALAALNYDGLLHFSAPPAPVVVPVAPALPLITAVPPRNTGFLDRLIARALEHQAESQRISDSAPRSGEVYSQRYVDTER